MNYDDTIKYLYNLQKYGIKFGLENINKLMYAFENPHLSFLTVHVAGTNGKGSTSAIISSILQTMGLTVGLFTSPHLINFTERIRINGKEIAEEEVINLAYEVRDMVERIDNLHPTFFEVVTAIAMLYFKRKNVDIGVFEVGMGGRLDATNIIKPEVSVITNIDFDHTEFLGKTLKEISFEKAGIIKNGVPVVTSSQSKDSMDIIRHVAKEKNANLYIYGKDFYSKIKKEDLFGTSFDYYDSDSEIRDLFLPLIGSHQAQNASLAIKAVKLLKKNIQESLINKNFINNWDDFIRKGIEQVEWKGRLEIIQTRPPILIDGAHNPQAAEAVSKTIKQIFGATFKNFIIIFGIMADKDIKGIIKPFLTFASDIILTSPAYSRAATPEKLAEIVKSMGFFNIKIEKTVKDAIEKAKELALTSYEDSLIVITGSFYTIGEAKEALFSKGILTTLRE